jgi:SNF2 family DNA or RNA helicase
VKYKFKTRPYRHQVQAMKHALSQFKNGLGVAFLMEPRTGKTKTTIDTLGALHLKYGLRKVVVVCPNRVMDVWVEEFLNHCPLRVQTFVWDANARKQPSLPEPHPAYDLQVVIVNYEAFGRGGKRTASGRQSRSTGRFKHRQKLLRWIGEGPAAGVLDEGHKIKSPSGRASNMIVSMRSAFKYRFLLTGTPITKAKRAHDIYMQWQWVNPRRFEEWGATVADFKNHTGRWISDNGYPQWVGPRSRGMEDLRTGLHRDGIVVLRDECLDLPPRNPDRIVKVPLGPSARHYDEMAQEMVTRLQSGAIAEASIPLVVTLRLLQITSGFVGIPERRVVRGKPSLVSVAHRVGFEKLNALELLLTEETLEREEKVVIAARFVADLNAIEELCTSLKIPVWSIRGGRSREDSTEAIRAFKRHEGAGAMVVQPAAASLGIDLSTAAHMIWFSLTPSWTDYTQCCDRIALSPRATTHTFLLADAPVDRLSYAALQADSDMSKMILRKPETLLRH